MNSKNKKGMSRSESGKLGALKSAIIWHKKRQDNIEKYNQSPNKCLNCGKIISYDKRTNKCCNHSCRASYINKTRKRKDAREKKECLWCGEKTLNPKFCNNECQWHYLSWLKFDKFERTGEIDANEDSAIRQFLRRYLFSKREHTCEICGLGEWLGEEIPLTLDHIDGNPNNHDIKNLRLICGNCGMLLPTFAGRNRGNGRTYRRQRYKDGRSY